MKPECDKCKHRRMFYDNYPCNECIRNAPNLKQWIDYFDENIKSSKPQGSGKSQVEDKTKRKYHNPDLQFKSKESDNNTSKKDCFNVHCNDNDNIKCDRYAELSQCDKWQRNPS